MSIYKSHILMFVALAACGDADAPAEDWKPLAADAQYAGLTRAEWAAEWGRWSYAQTSCAFSDRDEDGSHCGDYQDAEGAAFFLAGGPPGTQRTRCKVPSNQAIVLPLTAYLLDNAGVPEPKQLSESALRDKSERVRSTMNDLQLRIDGVEITDLETFAVEPTRFSYELPPEPNWYSCSKIPDVSGVVDPAFVTGYFVVLPAPSPGTHELEYGGVVYFGQTAEANSVKTTFTVKAAGE